MPPPIPESAEHPTWLTEAAFTSATALHQILLTPRDDARSWPRQGSKGQRGTGVLVRAAKQLLPEVSRFCRTLG